MKSTLNYTQDNLVTDIDLLVKNLAIYNITSPEWGVVGITEGGVVPAMYLAKAMKLRVDFWNPTADRILRGMSTTSCRKYLVIDEICDSGKTLYYVKKTMEDIGVKEDEMAFVTLIENTEQDVFRPDLSVRKIARSDTPEWFTFFWEKPLENLEEQLDK